MDIRKLVNERRRMTTFQFAADKAQEMESYYDEVFFDLQTTVTDLSVLIDCRPVGPAALEERERRCDVIRNIQATGLMRRLAHIH